MYIQAAIQHCNMYVTKTGACVHVHIGGNPALWVCYKNKTKLMKQNRLPMKNMDRCKFFGVVQPIVSVVQSLLSSSGVNVGVWRTAVPMP